MSDLLDELAEPHDALRRWNESDSARLNQDADLIPAPEGQETSEDTNLVGREEELSRLRGLVAPPHEQSQVLVILGDPGMGKSVLLAGAAREAGSAGMRVLAAAGRESEQDLAFAGLHQLLRPVLDRVDALPARQADALRGAFAISANPGPADALLIGIAVLALLSGLSEDGPVLVVADDAQWLDRASLEALMPGTWRPRP